MADLLALLSIFSLSFNLFSFFIFTGDSSDGTAAATKSCGCGTATCDTGQFCWSTLNFCGEASCSEIVTEAKKQTSNNGDGDNGLRRSLDSVSINSKACSCVGSQEAQSCSADVNGLWCGTSTGKEGARCAWTRAGLYYKRLTDSWLETGTLKKDIPVGPLGQEYFVVGSIEKEIYHNIHDAVRKYSKIFTGTDNCAVIFSETDCDADSTCEWDGTTCKKKAVENPYGPINEWDVSRITDLRCLFSTNGEAFGGTSAGKYSRPKTFVDSFLE